MHNKGPQVLTVTAALLRQQIPSPREHSSEAHAYLSSPSGFLLDPLDTPLQAPSFYIALSQREHRCASSHLFKPHYTIPSLPYLLQITIMPPKTATLDGQKMVPADCVSALLMALGSTTITRAQYDIMSALDGTRTASSFEHQFRTITAKAKEMKVRAENGETFQPVAPGNKRGKYLHSLDLSRARH
jgi:hypothetical protein